MNPIQSKAARAMLGLSRSELAVQAQVSFPAVTNFENGRETASAIVLALQQAFEQRGIVLVEKPGMAGVMIRT